MSNLLAQHWFIAKKHALFWILFLFFFVGGVLSALEYGPNFSLAGGIGFALTAVTAFFISAEGTSGRLDNEIITGFSRTQIWLSNFLLVFFLGLLLLAAAAAGDFTAAALQENLDWYNLTGLGLFAAGAVLNTGAYASLYTLTLMCCVTRSSGRGIFALILCMCIFLLFLICGSILSDRLSEPPCFTYYSYGGTGDFRVDAYDSDAELPTEIPDAYTWETGYVLPADIEPYTEVNPLYVSEPLRTQYIQILQFIPLTQMTLLADLAFTAPEDNPDCFSAASTMWLDAGIIIAGCTAAGLVLFRRRNLD